MHTTVSGALVQEKEICKEKKRYHNKCQYILFPKPSLAPKVLFRNGEDMLYGSHERRKASLLFQNSQSQNPDKPATK
jgi:hypothetical protein